MRDVLYEESINPSNFKTRKTIAIICDVLTILNIIAAVIFFYLEFLFLDSFTIITAVFLAIFALLFWFLKGIVYYCVDCAFVKGSTRLTKVVAYKKRKKIIKFDYSQVEIIGKFGSETFDKLFLDKGVKKIFATPNKYSENSFYVFLNMGGEKYLVILDCKEAYLKNLVEYTGKKVIEKDYQ